jgi:hypothetical protein
MAYIDLKQQVSMYPKGLYMGLYLMINNDAKEPIKVRAPNGGEFYIMSEEYYEKEVKPYIIKTN